MLAQLQARQPISHIQRKLRYWEHGHVSPRPSGVVKAVGDTVPSNPATHWQKKAGTPDALREELVRFI